MTGELASVHASTTVDVPGASMPLVWDAVSSTPMVLGVGGMSAGSVLGNMSSAEELGYGLGWSMSSNPWESAVVTVPTVPGLGMVSAGPAASSVNVAGLDFMGFRVADASVRRFVSTDALSSVPGIVHGADVNSFVGWNPISLADPWGLRPVTPQEIRKPLLQRKENFGSLLGIFKILSSFGIELDWNIQIYILEMVTGIKGYRDYVAHPSIESLNVKRDMSAYTNPPSVPPRDINQVAKRLNEVNDNQRVKDIERESGRKYSAIQIDVYTKNVGGKEEKVAYVYIPGTDFSDFGKNGEIGSVGNNLGLSANSTDKPIHDLSPYHRMVEEAMKQAGLQGADRVVMVGHSQGGAVAYSLANNKEFNSKYKVSNVVTYGAPNMNLGAKNPELQNEFIYAEVINPNDAVPGFVPSRRDARLYDPADRTYFVARQGEGENLIPWIEAHAMTEYVNATEEYVKHAKAPAVDIADADQYSVKHEDGKSDLKDGVYTGTNTSYVSAKDRAMYELTKK